MANWEAFAIQLPGQDLLEPVREVLETLLVFLEVLKAILDTVKAFLIALTNAIEALVKALIALIETLLQALNQTGLYAYFDIPNPLKDPNFYKHVGGYQAFTDRFKGSLLDTRDPNRPQPISGATQSGFVAIVADAVGPLGLIALIKILLQFFSRDFIQPRFAPPANVKIFPMGSKQNAITNLASAFSIQATGVSMSWTLGGGMKPPDPGYTDLASIVANEFIPPKWLIERSSVPVTTDVDVGVQNGVGRVTYEIPTLHEKQGKPGQFYTQKIHLTDDHGEPVIKFDTYQTLGLTDDNGNVLTSILNGAIGELGFIQWFDTLNIKVDQTYLYRIRAYTGTLDINPTTHQLNWATVPSINPKTRKPYLPWPGQGVVVGSPSGIFRVRIPKLIPNFDVVQNLRTLFIAAFSLGFHLPVIQPGQKDGTGALIPADTFDSGGNPTGSTPVWSIGKGSLTRYAGILGGFFAQPDTTANEVVSQNALAGALANLSNAPVPTENGIEVQQPFQDSRVLNQANRLAVTVASAFLEQGFNSAQQFQQIMQGPFPRGPLKPPALAAASNVSQLVTNITHLDADGNYDLSTFQGYIAAYTDASARRNILFAVQYVTNFLHGGVPPDWIKYSILRDLIPWAGQIIYDLLAKIQALADAFKSIMDEITEFIDAIERKITVLEQFIEFLIAILDYILSLSVGFYLLTVQSSGDVFDWFQQIDNATGTVPPSGPGGYSAGIVLAYVAIDPGAFLTAFELIF